MKFIKRLLLVLLLLVIIFLVYVALQPNDYNVYRTKSIKAPSELIYNNVNDFKNWKQWSPWFEMEPTAKIEYGNNTVGVGGNYSWVGEILGEGSVKTTYSKKDSIYQELKFTKPHESESNIYWSFKPEDNVSTKVTWGMKGSMDSFMGKMMMTISGGMDKAMGKYFDRGLEKLDSLMQIEAAKPKFKLSAISTKDLPAQKFIGYHQKSKIDQVAFTKLFEEFMPKVGKYVMSKLSYKEFTPAAVYTVWDEKNNTAEFYIGALITKDLEPAEGMSVVDLPAGKTLSLSKFGPYGTGDFEAHTAIANYMKANSLSENGAVWELYVNDPQKVKPEQIQTDIYYPVK